MILYIIVFSILVIVTLCNKYSSNLVYYGVEHIVNFTINFLFAFYNVFLFLIFCCFTILFENLQQTNSFINLIKPSRNNFVICLVGYYILLENHIFHSVFSMTALLRCKICLSLILKARHVLIEDYVSLSIYGSWLLSFGNCPINCFL